MDCLTRYRQRKQKPIITIIKGVRITKTLSFINQKGGTGKTTTCLSVGACLANKGYKVLLIDTDPQHSLTTHIAAETDDRATFYEVLTGAADPKEAIQQHGNYGIIPTDIRQSGTENDLVKLDGVEKLLKENVIRKLARSYDFVLMDCPPSLNLFTVMSLAASTGVIVPLQAQYLPLDGIAQLQDTYQVIKRQINPAIDIVGYVFTMYDRRINLYKQVYGRVADEYPGKPFKTTISSNVSLAEAPAFGMDIYEYAPKSKGAMQYADLTNELLERV